MDWFGDNIKNLTGSVSGQLSSVASFTRDVLTEGTEEVSDQGAELKVFQDKIRELDALVIAQKQENERLNLINRELEEKAESSELQINTISQQYRNVLHEKQDELKELKQRQHEMENFHSMMTMSPTMTTSTSTSSLSGSKIPDSHDFDDVISSQHEINRLSKEVTRLQAECDKMRRLHGAHSEKSNFKIGGDDENTSIDEFSLHDRIKELENQLEKEVDNHQHELSILQDAHIQKQSNIKRQHKLELKDLQDRLDLLQDEGSSSGGSTPHSSPIHSPSSPSSIMDVDRLQSELRESQHSLQKLRKDRQHLEESNKRLKVDLEQTRLVEKEKARTLQVLNRQLEAIQTEKNALFNDNEQFRKEKKDLREKLNTLQTENANIKGDKRKLEQSAESKEQEMQLVNSKLHTLQDKVKVQEDELDELRGDNDKVSTSTMRQELRHARNKFSSNAMIRRTKLLREKQVIVNKMIDIGEQVSESKSAVASLHAASSQMKSETSGMIGDLGDTEMQDLTSELVDTLEVENQLLREQVVKLENEVSDLNQSCSSLAGDKKECENLIVQLKQNLHRDELFNSQAGLDSETESVARPPLEEHVVQHIQYKRPRSPSDSSTETGESAKTGVETMDASSDGERRLVEGSDSISFDGEYDDSIMFTSMKQRFPEAAHVIQQQIEQFEMFQADWTMEKQALEDVVVHMRAQMKEKDMQMKQNITAQEGLLQVENEKQDKLQEQMSQLKTELSALEDKYTSLQSENESLQETQNISKEQSKELSLSFSEQTEIIDNLEEENMKMTTQLKEYLSNIESLQTEIKKHKVENEKDKQQLVEITRERIDQQKAIEELDQQHQDAISQVVLARDDLAKQVENLTSEMFTAKKQLGEANQRTNTNENQIKEIEDLTNKLSEERIKQQHLEEECANKTSELASLQQELQEQKVLSIETESSKKIMEETTRNLQEKIFQLKEERKNEKESEDRLDKLNEELSKLHKELSERVEMVSDKEKEISFLNDKIEALDAELVEIVQEKDRLNVSLVESGDKLQSLSTSKDDLQKVVSNLEMDLEITQTENETLKSDLLNKSKQFEVAMNEISESKDGTDAGEVEKHHLVQSKYQKETKVEELENQLAEMSQDLQETNDMLTSTLENNKKLSDVLKEKEEDIKSLAGENLFLQNTVEKQKTKLTEGVSVKEQKQQLEEIVEKYEEEKKMLNTELLEAQRKLQATPEREIRENQTLGIITELESEVETLRIEVKVKNSELLKIQNEMMGAKEQFEGQQDSLNDSRQMAEDLKELLQEKEKEFIEMNEQLNSRNQILDSFEEDGSLNNSIVLEKEAEINGLQKKLQQLTQDIDVYKETLLKKEEERNELLNQVDEAARDLANKDQILDNTKDEFENQIVTMESILTTSTEKLENISRELQIKDDNLSQVKFRMDKLVKEKDDDIQKLIEENEILKRELQDKQKDILELQTTAHLQVISNGTKDQSGLSDNEKQFEKIIKEREREISGLKEKVSVLTNLLDEKSKSVMGNSVLVDLHKAQMQVKTFEAERNQMMTVLNEKTRECSNLKNEVHRLLRVVSTDKNALDKAMEDNHNMVEKMKGPNNDMRKEALQNLSRLVQDKDLEIEALKLKNESLLQVLQTQNPEKTSDVSNLVMENSNLQKSNTVLIEERDQLVVSIHQKHQESLAYYEEVQRLAGIISTENQNHSSTKLQVQELTKDSQQKELELSTIKFELEDKNNLVIQLQDDLEKRRLSFSSLENDFSNLNGSYLEIENVKKDLESKLSASLFESENQSIISSALKEKEIEIIELRKVVDELNKSLAQGNNVVENVDQLDSASPPINVTSSLPLETNSVDAAELKAKEEEIESLKEKLEDMTNMQEIIKCLENELSEEKVYLQDLNVKFKEKTHDIKKKSDDIAMLKEQIDIQNQALMDKDSMTQNRSQELHEVRNHLKAREIELQTLIKQKETLQFELEGFRLEVEGHKKENLNLQHAIHNKDAECRQIQDVCNRMSAEIQEKNFEITTLKEKSATLRKLVDDDSNNHGQMQDLLRETEAMQKQAALFQQERDQVLLALQTKQAEMGSVQQQVQTISEKNQRLEKELSRLRNHLIEMEDSYTRDALQAEEREKELRNRIAVAEERAISSSTDVQKASFEATAQIESLLDQLHAITAQKEDAHIQLAAAHEQIQQYADSMANLEMVLEQFQQEKDAVMQTEIEQHQKRARDKERAAQLLLKQNDELKNKLEETKEALNGAMRLNEQLDNKEELIKKLKEEVYKKEEQAEEYHQKLIDFNTMNGSKVDKPLIRNLVVGYFTTPDAKKSQVLKLIGSVLEFSDSELQRVGAQGHEHKGWLSGLWSKPATPPPPSPRTTAANTSFMEQFVSFLETESTPMKKLRLPVEDMIKDEPRTPAFNPFSAPIPKESPFIRNTAPKSSGDRPPGFLQPTIAPVPMFSAVPVTPKTTLDTRSATPPQKGNILKEVLNN
ncbi:uncharacterized protein [Antedon mediterranea]|uniref:uncharacterized protein isoform X2 n=1 Tax=Antedon mediterranea TaxID=105859 RepID=UPI003AF9BE35